MAELDTEVVVVGGGYAGLRAAADLSGRGHGVTVVSPGGRFSFTTRLAAVAGATAPASWAFAPIDRLLPAVSVRAGRVTEVNEGEVRLDDGTRVKADAVIVATGSVPSPAPIPGLGKWAFPLRTAGDALRLRKAIEDTAAVTIIGAGPTGMQLGGALGVARPDLDVEIVDQVERPMGAFGLELAEHALRVVRGRKIAVSFATEVVGIDRKGVELSDGRTRRGLTVWAGGFSADGGGLGLPTVESGRLDVDPTGRIEGAETIFGAGDTAAHRAQGGIAAMSAQIAVQAGSAAARSVHAELSGQSAKSQAFVDRGWVVDLGGGVGVAELLGISLAGPVLDRLPPLLHDLIDARTLLQLGGIDALRRFGAVGPAPLRTVADLIGIGSSNSIAVADLELAIAG